MAYGTQDFYVASATVFPVLFLAGIVENRLSYTSGFAIDPPTQDAVCDKEQAQAARDALMFAARYTVAFIAPAILGESAALGALYAGQATRVQATAMTIALLLVGAGLLGTFLSRPWLRVWQPPNRVPLVIPLLATSVVPLVLVGGALILAGFSRPSRRSARAMAWVRFRITLRLLFYSSAVADLRPVATFRRFPTP